MVQLIFESHATTFDNEEKIASGHFDVELSPLGLKQAKELGDRYQNELPDIVFCSDLQRSYKTGELAFEGKGVKIIRDPRLRECDYGELTRHSSPEVDLIKKDHITVSFPEGESYAKTTGLVEEFLNSIFALYDGKTVMVIGHRATQYGLEHLLKGVPLEQAITTSWKWQPGWRYEMREKISKGAAESSAY